jgi:hypothetical protein
MIRNITGYGEGNGAYISIFEGFIGVDKWYQFGQGATSGLDRVNMDIHQYTVSRYRSPNPSGPTLTLPPCSVSKTKTPEALKCLQPDRVNGGREVPTLLETPSVSP